MHCPQCEQPSGQCHHIQHSSIYGPNGNALKATNVTTISDWYIFSFQLPENSSLFVYLGSGRGCGCQQFVFSLSGPPVASIKKQAGNPIFNQRKVCRPFHILIPSLLSNVSDMLLIVQFDIIFIDTVLQDMSLCHIHLICVAMTDSLYTLQQVA